MSVVPFLHGAVSMGCMLGALFFLRFWQQSRDHLFLWFASAFVLLGLSYGLLGTLPYATDWRVYIFVVRLVAFCLILAGIFEKNRR